MVTGVPFEMGGGYIITEVVVDDSPPLDFIFDTGSSGTVLNARAARELGIVGTDSVTIPGGAATGAADLVRSYGHVVRFGDAELRDAPVVIADMEHIERRIGRTFDGVIGWPILSQWAVWINQDTKRIELFDNRRFGYDLGTAPLELEMRGRGIHTSATVVLQNGEQHTGSVLIDTGFGGSVSFLHGFAQEAHLLTEADPASRQTTQSLSTDTEAYYTFMLSELSIGEHSMGPLRSRVPERGGGTAGPSRTMGIVGIEVLKRFNIFLDLEHLKMFLEPSHFHDEPFGSG
jgi:hypothetical protein